MTLEIEQTCYTLQSAPWLDNAGFEKGRRHDRQPLGFILPANTVLQIRQPDMSNGNATLRLLCDDTAAEKPVRWPPAGKRSAQPLIPSLLSIRCLPTSPASSPSSISNPRQLNPYPAGKRANLRMNFSLTGKKIDRHSRCLIWMLSICCCPMPTAIMR